MPSSAVDKFIKESELWPKELLQLRNFSGAKQSATRQSRIKKLIPRILQGKGLTDR